MTADSAPTNQSSVSPIVDSRATCVRAQWKGDTLIDGVPATLDMLKAAGKKIFFVTNNSTKSRKG